MASASNPYHNLVSGCSPDSFINLFRAEWKGHIQSFPGRYQAGKQLLSGSRFRPMLVCWGYLLSGSDFHGQARRNVAQAAVYVELLHKATLLIDDLIDHDASRNGEESFHRQF